MHVLHQKQISWHKDEIDILKGFAIVSVIILHSLPSELLSSWISILTIYQAVPIFFILIGRNYGASYLRRRYSTLGAIYSKDYFASNFNRIVLPFLLIFLISFLFGYLRQRKICTWAL